MEQGNCKMNEQEKMLDLLSCEKYLRAKNLLEIFEGNVPVSVFDASTKTYHKQQLGFDCTVYTLRELQKILGAENVVPK